MIKNERLRKTAGPVLRGLWAALAALLFPAWISDTAMKFSNSLFSVVFFAAVFLLLQEEAKRGTDRRRLVFTHTAGFIFSLLTAFGYALDAAGTIRLPRLLPAVLVFTHVLAAAVSMLWRLLKRADRAEKPAEGILKKYSCLIPVILLLCWLPAFLADYPGGFRYDAGLELGQVTENTGFRGDFPLLHSAIVTWLLPALYERTGTYATGVTVYVVTQMILMAAMYTHILRTLIRKGVHRLAVLYCLLYCAFFPVIHILAVQEVRDVMFAALYTYAVFCLYLLCTEKERILGSRWKPALCAAVLSLALLSRNNNTGSLFLILVILVNAGIWMRNFRKHLRGATVWAVSGVGSFLLIGWILTLICQPMTKAPTAGTSLALLSQSVTRAYVTEGENWTEEERQELAEYMDLEGIRYVPGYGDATKNRIRAAEDPQENAELIRKYTAFCLKMGLKYPQCALDAVFANTQDMWFPAGVVDGYKQYFTAPGQPYWQYSKNYFAILDENEEPVEHLSKAPGILNFYTKIGLGMSFEKVPVLSMFFSIGAQLWLLVTAWTYLRYRRETKLLLPVGAMLLYMIGNAFVPVILLRYFGGVFLCHPMIAAFLLQPEKASGTADPARYERGRACKAAKRMISGKTREARA